MDGGADVPGSVDDLPKSSADVVFDKGDGARRVCDEFRDLG